MLPGLVVACVLLVAALAWAIVAARSAKAGRTRVAELEATLGERDAALAAQGAELVAAREAAGAATNRADAAEQRARTEATRAEEATRRGEAEAERAGRAEASLTRAESLAGDERTRADRERERADRERSRAEEAGTAASAAEQRADAAARDLLAVQRTLDPEGLWLFERRRLCRIWRDWVSVQLDAPCPLPARPDLDAVQAGIEILTAASREEIGVPIDLAWHVDPGTELTVAGALVVLRAADELVATARRTNGGELGVTIAPGAEDARLALVTAPDQVVPTDLVASGALVGWTVEATATSLAVTLPGVVRPA